MNIRFHKTPRDRIELLLVISGLLLLAAVLRFEVSGDGAIRYRMLQMFVDEHRVAAEQYSLVHPITSIPLYIMGKIAGQPQRVVERFNLFIFCGMLLVIYRRLSSWTDSHLLCRWFLVMLTCSMFLHHLRMFYTEVFSTAGIVVGLVSIVTNAPIAGALTISISIINSPPLLLPLMITTFKLSWDAKKLWYFGIPACTVVGILAEGWMRRGSPFLTGYEGNRGFQTLLPYSGLPGFSYPLILGILSILFSFGKGLLFFTPGLVLVGNEAERISPGAKLRQLQQLLLLFTFGMVLVYAKWWAWYGGWFWGPRFFLFASVPASLALAVQLERPHDSAWKNIFVLAILLLSAWVGVDGALFGQDGLEVGTANNYALESLIWYVPEFSPLWHPFIARRRLVPRDWAVAAYTIIVVAWLAGPLVRRLALQTRLWVRTLPAAWKAGYPDI